MEQFFGTTTWRVFFGLALATIFGALIFRVEILQIVGLLVLMIGSGVLYVKRPETAFVLVFAELFGFSHGRLLATPVVGMLFTSRMAIFVGVMVTWGMLVLLRKRKIRIAPVLMTPWVLLGVAVLIGLVIGLIRNVPSSTFDDFNAYVYALYLLPLLSITWNRVAQRRLLQTLTGSALWISVLSLLLLYVFTHLPNDVLTWTYKFIRDARIGEITLMEGGYWRVFFQSQIVLIWMLPLFLFFDVDLAKFQARLSSRLLWVGSVFAGIAISLSRSFWVGLLVASPLLLFYLFLKDRRRQTLRAIPRWIGGVLVGMALLATSALMTFPLPSRVVDLRETFSSRTSDAGDLAVSSRWNLLPVMIESMRGAPILGSGFGKELAFVSDDPRVREIYPDGKWRTYKFEWGWLDVWVKMGAIGFFAFVALFLTYDRLLRESVLLPTWLSWGLRFALVSLAGTHLFSPYLNHPLGIGLFLFVTAFLTVGDEQEKERVEKEKVPILKTAFVRPVVTTRARE